MTINIRDYRYGQPSNTLKKAVEFLNTNGRRDYTQFDFPDYAGLPKSTSSWLSTDEVDFLQEHWSKLV